MLYVFIAVLGILAVGYFVVKRVHAAAAIFVVGVLLMLLAAAFKTIEPGEETSGNLFYDQLVSVESIFQSKLVGAGLAIMVLFGFVAYMRHIGADAKAVVLLSAPLRRLHGSYWLVPVGFLVGTLLSLVVPSASALSALLVATLLPALVAGGLTPLTVGAIIATSSTIVPTPLEAGIITGADLVGMPVSEYTFNWVARATIPTLIITAFVHMWWQRRCDIKDREKAMARIEASGGDASSFSASNEVMSDALERARAVPAYYALLPLLPLLVMVVAVVLNRVGILPFEMDILPATIVSLFIALAIDAIRRRSLNAALDSMGDFFKGMGEGAAGVVALLIAAGVLVQGLTDLGLIDKLIQVVEGSSGAATAMIILFVIAVAFISVLTGSGVAPYNAFAAIVPGLAEGTGILPVRMLNAMWGTSNLMRQVSPVCAAVLIVAGAIKVNPIDLVKRTAVPMIVATVLNTLFSFLFITV